MYQVNITKVGKVYNNVRRLFQSICVEKKSSFFFLSFLSSFFSSVLSRGFCSSSRLLLLVHFLLQFHSDTLSFLLSFPLSFSLSLSFPLSTFFLSFVSFSPFIRPVEEFHALSLLCLELVLWSDQMKWDERTD